MPAGQKSPGLAVACRPQHSCSNSHGAPPGLQHRLKPQKPVVARQLSSPSPQPGSHEPPSHRPEQQSLASVQEPDLLQHLPPKQRTESPNESHSLRKLHKAYLSPSQKFVQHWPASVQVASSLGRQHDPREHDVKPGPKPFAGHWPSSPEHKPQVPSLRQTSPSLHWTFSMHSTHLPVSTSHNGRVVLGQSSLHVQPQMPLVEQTGSSSGHSLSDEHPHVPSAEHTGRSLGHWLLSESHAHRRRCCKDRSSRPCQRRCCIEHRQPRTHKSRHRSSSNSTGHFRMDMGRRRPDTQKAPPHIGRPRISLPHHTRHLPRTTSHSYRICHSCTNGSSTDRTDGIRRHLLDICDICRPHRRSHLGICPSWCSNARIAFCHRSEMYFRNHHHPRMSPDPPARIG
mmetsp:Transcript_34906/g.86663  ORF Transcript_34906/g.86663 Transcript_34906/m.86663 type:complete len:398 (-) Transcript_34906:521-1714(-)